MARSDKFSDDQKAQIEKINAKKAARLRKRKVASKKAKRQAREVS